MSYRIGIDVGGTFTDFQILRGDGTTVTTLLLDDFPQEVVP